MSRAATPDVFVVVPFARPSMASNVMANFIRQSYEKKRLLLVQNGAAAGTVSTNGLVDVVLDSEASPGAARNAAIEWLTLNEPGAYYVAMDDDDIYGADYVAEHATLAQRGTVWCKKNMWALLDSGLYHFNQGPGFGGEVTGNLMGATFGGWVSDVSMARFDPDLSCCEEIQFGEGLRAAGVRVRCSSGRHFCYIRTNPIDHQWQASERKFHRYIGPSVRVDAAPLEVIDTVPYGPSAREGGPRWS